MADFQDIEDSQRAKWDQLLTVNGIKFDPDKFPFGYYKEERGESSLADLTELKDSNPKKALCMLYVVAVHHLVKKNVIEFVSRRELNIEFNDLLEQALQYGISIS